MLQVEIHQPGFLTNTVLRRSRRRAWSCNSLLQKHDNEETAQKSAGPQGDLLDLILLQCVFYVFT